MANVNIKFNNKEFLLSCEDGQEEHLEELALYLDKKFNNLKSTLGNIGENKLLLIAAITTMDATTISLGTDNMANGSGEAYTMYGWTTIKGYYKMHQ